MAQTRTKTLSYRRAVWLTPPPNGGNLEAYIVEAYKKVKTVGDRKFERNDGQFVKGGKIHSVRSGGICLHVIAETPGDMASVTKKGDDNLDDAEVDTAPPPDGAEFMDGDIFLYVRGNHVCMCATGIREGAIHFYLSSIFNKARLPVEATQFELQRVADVNKVKMIRSQGVKEVDLAATLYDASLKYINRRDTPGLLGVVGKHIGALFGKDSGSADENLMVTLGIRTDGRRKGTVLAAKRLEKIAEDVVGYGDHYKIITGTGQTITGKDIFIRKRVSIERHGKSVSRSEAYAELRLFYKDLADSGALGQ